MIDETLIENNVDWSGRNLMYRIIQAFAWMTEENHVNR
jgi:hypothetical protein